MLFAAPARSAAQAVTISGTITPIWIDKYSPPRSGGVVFALIDSAGRVTTLDLSPTELARVGGARRLRAARVSASGTLSPVRMGQAQHDVLSGARIGVIGASAAVADLRGSRPFATVLCRFSDTATPAQPSAFQQTFAGTGAGSVDEYWRETSNGEIDMLGSRVFGWFDLPNPAGYYIPLATSSTAVPTPDFSRLMSDCLGAADSAVDFNQFYGVFLQFSKDFYGGVAYGGPTWPITLEGRARLLPVTFFGWPLASLPTVAHEVGHGFGLPHSSGPYSATYDSKWDLMSDNSTYQQTIAYHKEALGVLTASRVFTAASAGTAIIQLERNALPSAGTSYLLAKIPLAGAGRFYSVEARRRVGHDSQLPAEGVIISQVDLNRQDRTAQIVDVDGNGDPNDAAAVWVPGETFTDATNGVQVRVDNAFATGYQITIITGAARGARTLTLTMVGAGEVAVFAGAVTRCFASCVLPVGDGASITLSASSASGTALAGWSGDCALWDSAADCRLSVSGNLAATATFVPSRSAELRVTGLGAVYAFTQPHPAPGAMFGCDTRAPVPGSSGCVSFIAAMPRDSIVDFFQYPAPGWMNGPWGGDCVGGAILAANWCRVVASTGRVITAAFQGGATISASPLARHDSMAVGASAIFADSAQVTIAGPPVTWTASTNTPWIRLSSATATGSGMVRWTRQANALPLGLSIGLITVTSGSAYRSPVNIIDSLSVLPALALDVQLSSRRDSVLLGNTDARADSSAISLKGIGATSVGWTATHLTNSWLKLQNTSGVGSGVLRWTRNPAGLSIGIYRDTITITAAGASGTPRVIDQTMEVFLPSVTIACAVDVLLSNSPCMGGPERGYLDGLGNHDGTYNLGDLLAYLDRSATRLSVSTMQALLSHPTGATGAPHASRPRER